MQTFQSDGIEIAFIDEGEGEPIVLLHGFASNLVVNWVDPGWVRLPEERPPARLSKLERWLTNLRRGES